MSTSAVLEELDGPLRKRLMVAEALVAHLTRAMAVYRDRDAQGVNLPPCSRGHLENLLTDLNKYVKDTRHVIAALPSVLANVPEEPPPAPTVEGARFKRPGMS